MTPLELKTTILANMEPMLGTYTTSNRQTLPAIWIGEDVPSEWDVSGIECNIYGTPRTVRQQEISELCANALKVKLFYDVVFKRWDNTQLLQPAVTALLKLYPAADGATTLPPTQYTLEQATVTVPFWTQL